MKLLSRIWLAMAAMLSLFVGAPVLASLSQGFATTTTIAAGSLVSLNQKSSGSVEVADLNNASRLFGVVVPPSSASISLSGSGSGQVQVVTTGTAQVLVTTAGGNIHVGDYISVSQIAGVGQKVGASSSRVVGTAQADFNGTGDGVTKRTIDNGGGKNEVAIGEIPVVISVSSYTATDGLQAYVVPNWLQHMSNTLAGGKTVAPIRIVIAGLILVVAMVSISVLLYSVVRNGIISIGRNPLAKIGVVQGILAVGGVAVGILAITSGAIYVVLSR